jgi:hypothetical protein
MKTKILFIIMTLLCLTSCYRAYLTINGVRNPRVESRESVEKKCKHYDKMYNEILCIPKDSTGFVNLFKALKGLPSDLIFNKKGQLIMPIDTGYCAGKARTFALELDKSSVYPINPSYDLNYILDNVIQLGSRVNINANEFDYTMVFFWANFLGRANSIVFKIMDEMRSSSPLKINYILVNMDIQESWKMSKMPYQDIEIKPKR